MIFNNKWEKVQIRSLGEIVTGKTPKTSINENFGDDLMFLTPSDDMERRYVISTERKLTDQGAKEVANKILPKNSVCVSCIGSKLGKVVITTDDTVTNQQINSIIPNKRVDYMYLYYAMLLVGKRINFLSKTSTAVPIINKTKFSNEEIFLPPIMDQRKIANLLSSFDKKIENNNAIILNLEAQAQTIFKSWFIDFEPFKSEEFVDSELGKIPKGWEFMALTDILNFENGCEPGSKNYISSKNDGIQPFYRVGEMLNTTDIFVKEELLKGKIANGDDILVSFDGTVGRVVTGLNGGFSSGIKRVSFKDETISNSFLYVLFKSEPIQNIIQQHATGTTILHASKSIDYMFIPYEKNHIKEIINILEPMINKIRTLKGQNIIQGQIRDTLLPKLMSGEIRVGVDEIEEIENQM